MENPENKLGQLPPLDFSSRNWGELEVKLSEVKEFQSESGITYTEAQILEEIARVKIIAHSLPDAQLTLQRVKELCGRITRTGHLRGTVAQLIYNVEYDARGLGSAPH